LVDAAVASIFVAAPGTKQMPIPGWQGLDALEKLEEIWSLSSVVCESGKREALATYRRDYSLGIVPPHAKMDETQTIKSARG